MLLLVTGASGMGKTTARRLLQPQVSPQLECAELWDLSPNPPAQNLVWRQQATELAAQRAAQLQREGRHLLLCGDPIAAVEVAAAPSADTLGGLAFCLLDASPGAQAARLDVRGDDPALLVHHHAFADWMRHQATDPGYMLEVVTTNGWEQMRWDRIPPLKPRWSVHTVDTTQLTPLETAENVKSWLYGVFSGDHASVDLRPTEHPAHP